MIGLQIWLWKKKDIIPDNNDDFNKSSDINCEDGKAVGRVAGNKMKTHYFTNVKLTTLVRMAIGVPFVPVDRILDSNGSSEVLDLLNIEANSIKEPSVKKFAIKFVKYIEKTWIKGNYPPSTWNYYLRR